MDPPLPRMQIDTRASNAHVKISHSRSPYLLPLDTLPLHAETHNERKSRRHDSNYECLRDVLLEHYAGHAYSIL